MEKQEWTEIPDKPGWEQCVFQHECSGWGKSRRFVAVRSEQEEKPEAQLKLMEIKRYDYFCYVGTEQLSPWATHLNCHHYHTNHLRLNHVLSQPKLTRKGFLNQANNLNRSILSTSHTENDGLAL
jgi:hypothetical protein